MTLQYNGNNVEDVSFNNSPLDFVKFNGTIVWQRYATGTIMFEKSVNGTYTFTVPATTNYRIYTVGGGGGSAILSYSKKSHTGQGQNTANVAAGGSGGYIAGTFSLTAGDTLTIVVGKLASNAALCKAVDGDYWGRGGTGSNTTVKSTKLNKTILTAKGGVGGYVAQKLEGSLTGVATTTGGEGGGWAYDGGPTNLENQKGGTGLTDAKKGTGSVSASVQQTNSPYTYGRGSGGSCAANDREASYNQNYNGSDGCCRIEIA